MTGADTLRMRVLAQEDVIRCGATDPAAVLAAVREAFLLKAAGAAIEPAPATVGLDAAPGQRMVAHAGWLGGPTPVGGVKWICANGDNPRLRGIPRANALVILSDPETGLPRAVVEGTVISAMRTAGATALAATVLARPRSTRLAVIGAGVANRSQLALLRHVLPKLREVRLYDIDAARARQWAADEGARHQVEITPVTSAYQAVRDADVVVCATADSVTGYVEPDWLAPGVFVAGVSHNDLTDAAVLAADRLVTTDAEGTSTAVTRIGRLCGDGRLERSAVDDLGAVVSGAVSGRREPDDRIVFDAWGLGILDLAVADMVLRHAEDRDAGQAVPVRGAPHWR
ncbi:ornithine cyclodeaminase family protein [Phytohabitans kaempferiae]|uniref:Ornithine cyclodeaminase family protein n=1 Tax=Phytohabitans kaempferiae TaxID=1620943 RepID=A0ABV6MA31_9ACTN